MKIMKRIKAHFYSLLILIFLSSSVFLLPSRVVFSAPGDQPTITITSPTANALLNKTQVAISGTYTDENVQPADLLFTTYDKASPTDPDVKISDSDTNAVDWSLSNNGTSGTWNFTKTLAEGPHIITIELKEKTDPQLINQTSITFTIDTARPYITGTSIVLSDTTERTGEDLTSIPQDAKVKIILVDNKQMTQLVSKIQDTTNPYNPIKVMLGSNQVAGTASIKDNGVQSGKYSYDLIFTPSNPLALNTTYLVYLDPNLLDDSNNAVYAKFFKFTTKSDLDAADNPHGHYALNTNMCAACHSTHVGSNNSLEGGSYQITFNDKLKADPSENYCMACHDGTTNAPVIDKINSKYHHNNPADYSQTGINNLKEANSCTSCHNPHLDWSEQNQNLLKDHYVYTHNAADNVTPAQVDSLDTPCDSCHGDNEVNHQNTTSGNYELFSYKKSTSAVGQLSDYSLCLRCHNTAKKTAGATISDIETYYKDPSSGHNFTFAANQSTQADGSSLNGRIPCAECHDTHGSNNIMNLREELGNVKLSDADKFKTTGNTWTASDERTFCLKCHNNTTEIYGKTGIFNVNDSDGNPISGHQQGDTQACSYCHGGASRSSIEAAHAPKKTTP